MNNKKQEAPVLSAEEIIPNWRERFTEKYCLRRPSGIDFTSEVLDYINRCVISPLLSASHSPQGEPAQSEARDLKNFLYNTSKKFEREARQAYEEDKGTLANDLQSLQLGLFEAALRAEKVQDYSPTHGTQSEETVSQLSGEAGLRRALEYALEWIDAVPKDTVLPAMPGFDRDWANNLLSQS